MSQNIDFEGAIVEENVPLTSSKANVDLDASPKTVQLRRCARLGHWSFALG